MAGAQLFDLILLGYRNDLARERTLDYLREQPAAAFGPAQVERASPLPHRLYHAVDYEHGFRLLVPLRQRGAQVRLVAVAADEVRVGAAAPDGGARQSAGSAWTFVLFALIAGAAVWSLRLAPHAILPAKPPLLSLTGPAFAPDAPLANLGPNRLNDEALQLNDHGDYAAATDRLRRALAEEPENEVLRSNLRAVLRNWAVAEVNAGRYASAIDRAEEALELAEDAGVIGILGVAQARLGEWEKAREVLERALTLGAEDPASLFALGTAYRQLGRLEPAVEMLQRARDAGARGTDFEETLTKLQRELDAEWGFAELTSPHFQIGFEEGENHGAARLVLAGLEEAYFHVGLKLGFYPTSRTPVVLYPEEEFHDVTQVPSWTGGVFDGRIKLPVRGLVQDSPLLDRTLRHEFAHVVVSQLSRNRAPVWLSEGVAIWAEESADGEREEWARETISGRHLLALGELDLPFTRLPTNRVPTAYAQSYLAVRSILAGAGAVHLRELLETLGEGRTLEETFESVLSRRVADFEADLIQDLTS